MFVSHCYTLVRTAVLAGLFLGLVGMPLPAEARPLAVPTSGEIAFERENNIWLHDLATGQDRQLTTEGAAVALTWTPDGQRLVYEATTNGNSQIFLMNADGSQRVQMPHAPGGGGMPAFSPTGGFYYIADAATAGLSAILFDPMTGAPPTAVAQVDLGPGICGTTGMSVSAKRDLAISLSCGRGQAVIWIDPATGQSQALQDHVSALSGCSYDAAWAAGSPRLAVLTSPDCAPDARSDLQVVDFAATPPRSTAITAGKGLAELAWSPDEQWIAFSAYLPDTPPGIWAVAAQAGATPVRLIQNGRHPAWRPASSSSLPGMPVTGQSAAGAWIAGLLALALGLLGGGRVLHRRSL